MHWRTGHAGLARHLRHRWHPTVTGPGSRSSVLATQLTATLSDGNTRILLAEKAGHLIGYAQFSYGATQPLVAAQSSAELERLYVQERFTGTGVGKALLQQTERLAAEHGSIALWLKAWVGNYRALAFYPRQGYEDIGSGSHCFDGEEHENRVFMKSLGCGSGPQLRDLFA